MGREPKGLEPSGLEPHSAASFRIPQLRRGLTASCTTRLSAFTRPYNGAKVMFMGLSGTGSGRPSSPEGDAQFTRGWSSAAFGIVSCGSVVASAAWWSSNESKSARARRALFQLFPNIGSRTFWNVPESSKTGLRHVLEAHGSKTLS